MSGGKRVFITGGASGLGRALAERYAKAGWRVAIGDINDQRGAETLSVLKGLGGVAEYCRCDVTQESDLIKVAAWLEQNWGGVDLVFNNAGVALSGNIEDVSLDDWQWVVDIDLLGVVRGCKAFVPLFKRQGSGHLVNVASLAGLVHPPRMAPYNTVKAAVVSLSETLYAELAASGIAVSVVCPGFFRSNLAETARTSDADSKRRTTRLVNKARRTSDDIAKVVIRGVERREFRILPDVDGRKAWRLKRMLPFPLFVKALNRMFTSGYKAAKAR